MWVYFSVFYSVLLIYVTIVPSIPHSLDNCSHRARQYWVDWFFQIYSFSKIDLVLVGPVPFHIHVWISLSMPLRIPCWNYERNWIEPKDQIGEYQHLYSVMPSNKWTQCVSPFIWVLFDFFHYCFINFSI